MLDLIGRIKEILSYSRRQLVPNIDGKNLEVS